MSEKLVLRVEPQLTALEKVDAAAEEFGRAANWPEALAFQVRLVLEEVVINVVKHGYGDGERAGFRQEIEISISSEAGSLTIEISDGGRAFNPLKDGPEPDLDAALEDRPVGGLGLHLVRTLMDTMRYRRSDGRNHLTLVKRTDG